MPGAVRVENLHDLQAGFAKLEKDVRLGFRAGLREVAEPVRAGTEQLAIEKIRRMPHSPRWSKMRVGITRNLVYIAPRQRGVKTRARHNFGRPNLGDLLMARAMEPALDRHAAEVEARFGQLLDRTLDRFNHGGI